MVEIGNLYEIRGEKTLEWNIRNFSIFSNRTNIAYSSRKFNFSGTSWNIWMYPNGETSNASEGWISLYLIRNSDGIPVNVNYTFSLKTHDGKSDLDNEATKVFDVKGCGWGFSKVIRNSVLIERKSELLPSDILTIICMLKNSDKHVYNVNEDSKKACFDAFAQTDEGTGVWELQENLREIFLSGDISDVVLKVDDQEFKSHRCILAARSPVFMGMMTHEMKEKNTNVVDVPDADPNTFPDFLNYLYTGSKENVTSQNVMKLYTAADKYQVDELKKVCVDYMRQNMTVDNFCDFLTLSLRHVEKDLTAACSQFFSENLLTIVVTSKWQMFLNENPVTGNELYIKVIKQLQLNK